MRRFVSAVVLAAAGLGALAAYHAGTHADVHVYNGFDELVQVRAGDEQRGVAPRGHAVFEDLDAGPATFTAAFAGADEPFESVDVDLGAHAGDVVVYNVGGRALLSLDFIRYGPGEPPEGRWLDAGPMLFLDDVDYPFETPPEQKEVREGSSIQNSVLSAADTGAAATDVMTTLFGADRIEQARAVGLAELELHPEDAVVAFLLAQGTMESPEEKRDFFQGLLARAPDAVDLHRYYQELWPRDDNAAVIAEYRAYLAEHPDSPMAHYLVGRLVDGDEAHSLYRAALRLDPDYGPAYRALGYRASERGEYAEAARHYGRFAAASPEQALEVLDQRLRLARRTEGPEAVDALLAEALAASEQNFQLEVLRRHLVLEAQPDALDALIGDVEEKAQAWFGLGPESPDLRRTRADLAITAGDLGRARAELVELARMREPAIAYALRLALSDGAEAVDVERLQESGDEWPGMLVESYLLVALELVAEEDRARWIDEFGTPELAELGRKLELPSELVDVEATTELVRSLVIAQRSFAYLAAARALRDEPGSAARRARRIYQERARALSVPGELPFGDA